jgi:hypothetical protein
VRLEDNPSDPRRPTVAVDSTSIERFGSQQELGVLILIGLYLSGRRPSLSGLAAEVPTPSDRSAVS